MRHKFLSTTALLAALAIASGGPAIAQGPEPKGGPQGSTPQAAPPQQPQAAPQGNQSQGRDEGPKGRESKGMQSQGEGKSPAAQSREQRQQGQSPKGSASQPQGQSPKGAGSQRKDQTTGQGERSQGERSQGNQGQTKQQNPDRPDTGKGQAQQPSAQPDRDGARTQTQSKPEPQPGRDADRQGQPQRAGRDDGSVNLSAEQRTRIRTTVLAGNNVPRVNNVNFSISVGTVVPRHVRVVQVPAVLIEIYPQWRGQRYFVAQDEIIIIDRDYRIVSVVAVGSGSGAQFRGTDSVMLSLSSDEIRQVQIVLRERGFAIEVDGVMGPRTRQAIVAFQRQNGLQATGEIDQNTSVALGVGNSNPDQTTGQGSRQSPPSQPSQGPARDDRPGPQTDTMPEPGEGTGNRPSERMENQPSAR